MSHWNETAWFVAGAGVAIKSMVVLGAAWLTVLVMRRRSAAARHLVWSATFAALLALPWLSVSLPAWRIQPVSAFLTGMAPVVFQANAATPLRTGPQSTPQAGARARIAVAGRPDWRMILMLLWAAGAGALLARMLAAGTALRRARRSAALFPDRKLPNALMDLLVRRKVDVLQASTGTMPMTCGLLRPAVLLPSDAAEWDQERLKLVLMHELAHVRRGDVGMQLMARLSLAFHWWNPLAWAAWRGFLKEQERAADDLVLNAGARASEYAVNLLEVARRMQITPAAAWAAVPMARPSQLEGRLVAILDSAANRKSPRRISRLISLMLALVLVMPLAAFRPQDSGSRNDPSVPANLDAAILSARSQRNYETLETHAKAAESLRKYDAAQKLLEAAVAMRGEIAGEQSLDYGIGLMKLADLEKTQRHGKSAESLYARAVQILGERPEAAPALLYLGTAAILNKHFPEAIQYFEHAGSLDPAIKGRALMWSAIVRQREQNPADAETLFKNALSAQDARSKDAAITTELYAQFLREQGRDKEANELFVEAMNIQEAVSKPTRDGVYRVGNGVQAPAVLQKVDPAYTDEARAAKLSGTVIVWVEVGTDGLAHNARVMRGLGLGLDESAMDAISQWHFRPGLKDNQPVTVAATIEVNFRLQ